MPAAEAAMAAEAVVTPLAQPRAPRSSVPAVDNKQQFPLNLAVIVQSSVVIASRPRRADRAAAPAVVDVAATIAADAAAVAADATNSSFHAQLSADMADPPSGRSAISAFSRCLHATPVGDCPCFETTCPCTPERVPDTAASMHRFLACHIRECTSYPDDRARSPDGRTLRHRIL
jgi:hypothetical protein